MRNQGCTPAHKEGSRRKDHRSIRPPHPPDPSQRKRTQPCRSYCAAGEQVQHLPGALARSNYVISIDTDLCSACEICVGRCPVDAITIDESATVDEDRCVGCGVCVPSCPTGAVILVRREDEQITDILDSQTWLMNTLREKGTI